MREEAWDILSDNRIWNLLGDVQKKIGPEMLRLLFIEFFSRIKRLEQENLTLKAVLLQHEAVSIEELAEIFTRANEFTTEVDGQREKEINLWSETGIPFNEYVNFVLRGRFKQE